MVWHLKMNLVGWGNSGSGVNGKALTRSINSCLPLGLVVLQKYHKEIVDRNGIGHAVEDKLLKLFDDVLAVLTEDCSDKFAHLLLV